eukprot:3428523-Prymnesium_polylepis.1
MATATSCHRATRPRLRSHRAAAATRAGGRRWRGCRRSCVRCRRISTRRCEGRASRYVPAMAIAAARAAAVGIGLAGG